MEKMKLQWFTLTDISPGLLEDSVFNIIEFFAQAPYLTENLHVSRVETVYHDDGATFAFYATDKQTKSIKEMIKAYYDVNIE